ncbi:CG4962 [Drosophila busckii]|uniref:CG4962 n=1 Tax=Drosophila busckii TaxID=30019 RepID=A0A0M5J115_DROBS|nr:cuticle protein 64 [Drosophila busckii]ALC43948.1 CG4962 [Drosophila busckii]
MFKLFALLSALCAVANAGLIAPYSGYGHGYGLGYGSGYGSYGSYGGHYAAPAVISHAPIIKSYAAPIVHAPIVKTIHPVATSYANTYKVATKAYPVVHAAPLIHHAPAVVAAPALHTTSTYHGHGLGLPAYGLGYTGYGHGGYLH